VKASAPDTDFFVGLVIGPLLLWILFLCSTVLRTAIVRVAKDKIESAGARILIVVIGIVFYGALPLGILINLADSPPMLGGAVVGGVGTWLWFRGDSSKKAP
jgi:hypothetical protein